MSRAFINRTQQKNVTSTFQRKIDPVAQKKWLNNHKVDQGWGVFGDNQVSQLSKDNVSETKGGFTDRAWPWVENLLNKIEGIIDKLSEKVEEKVLILSSEEEITERKRLRTQNQIKALRAKMNLHLGVISEINTLASSSQVYDVITSNSNNSGGNKTGVASFNFTNGNFEITMPTGAGIELFAHELFHAYQFETGNFSVGRKLAGVHKNFLYDKHDEVDAYERQDLYGSNGGIYGIDTLPPEYDDLADVSVDINTHPNTKSIVNVSMDLQKATFKRIAKNTGHAFRVNGVTYYKKK